MAQTGMQLDRLSHQALAAAFGDPDDQSTHHELCRRALPLPLGLEVSWLGTAGYRFDFEGQTLLVDPYFTRYPLSFLVARRKALPSASRIKSFLPNVQNLAGVLLGHTHFDHAIDAPLIAKLYGCDVYGSASAAHLMSLHGLGHRAVEPRPHRSFELGPFEITFVPSKHSKLILGRAVPFAGELTCEHLDGLCPSAYRCGQVFGVEIKVAGVTFYHQGSADLIDSEIGRRDVDIFLAGIAGRSVTPNYWRRVLGKLKPDVVVPGHFDDFFRPLDVPMGFARGVKLASVPDEVASISSDIDVVSMPLLQPRMATIELGERPG